eukprot:scaffold76679_cov19-Tisochrysis_lutea.AAC.1
MSAQLDRAHRNRKTWAAPLQNVSLLTCGHRRQYYPPAQHALCVVSVSEGLATEQHDMQGWILTFCTTMEDAAPTLFMSMPCHAYAPSCCFHRIKELADLEEDVDKKMAMRKIFRTLQGVNDEPDGGQHAEKCKS